MTTKHDDGGLAFPESAPGCQPSSGMSLRDYFAGQAMAHLQMAFVVRADADGYEVQLDALNEPSQAAVFETAARIAYGLADAMIAEKRRREGA